MPKRNSKRKITLPAALVLCVVAVVFYLIQDQETETAPVSSYPEGCTMEVHFIDVGQGMATLIQHEGENLLIGEADTEHYKTLVAACVGNGHSVIAKSPLDINICKQLNILITEMNMPADKIVIDPLVSSVGYGIEYAYSIMERGRMGALQGDKMLSMPIIAAVGFESWRQKEAWGAQADRGPAWEATTAAACLQAGTDILLMRHPVAVKAVKKHIDALMAK